MATATPARKNNMLSRSALKELAQQTSDYRRTLEIVMGQTNNPKVRATYQATGELINAVLDVLNQR